MYNKPIRFVYEDGIFVKLYEREQQYKYLKNIKLPPFGQVYHMDRISASSCGYLIDTYFNTYGDACDEVHLKNISTCIDTYLKEFLENNKENTYIKKYFELPILDRCQMFKRIHATCFLNIAICLHYTCWEIPNDNEVESYIINTFGERYSATIMEVCFLEYQYAIQPYFFDKVISELVDAGMVSFNNDRGFQKILNIVLAVIEDRGQIVCEVN